MLFATLAFSPWGYALDLGELELNSALNEPFDAQIRISQISSDALNRLQVAMAPETEFRYAGIERAPILSRLEFHIASDQNGNLIRITSKEPVKEPLLTFLIEVKWPQVYLLREYAVLLSPRAETRLESITADSDSEERASRADSIAQPVDVSVKEETRLLSLNSRMNEAIEKRNLSDETVVEDDLQDFAIPVGVESFPLPSPEESIVGRLYEVTASYEDTLPDIARRSNLGYQEIVRANPTINPWLPGGGARVLLPTQYILPDAPREGIVVNVAEMRLYFYPTPVSGEAPRVITYPVSIGRGDWETPLAATEVIDKVVDPAWYPPESIRKEHAAEGDPLPKVVPPGPDNPLGRFALRLGLPGYLIHSTNKPYGVGMRVTHGCVRMYPEAIETLFPKIAKGTPVRIVNQPYKTGWKEGELYLEVHPPSAEGLDSPPLTPVIRSIVVATRDQTAYPIDWERVQTIASSAEGVPFSVSARTVSSDGQNSAGSLSTTLF